ncbi:GNAT family N-acetyltransferase [Rhodoferax aquaticus]|uniref:GNAT family N-acetyltransferase n=2 Tax=Rhodoferax aquaticus TaxID=2527691 RepID=A0A515EV98_9BURK|nr:GNAT family N-acetyltransferase [Rhodoferax aquaticus]
MHIRRLTPEDASVYWDLRLRGFREHPSAFTSSYEEEVKRPLTYAQARLGSDSSATFWGAWEGNTLMGLVGLDRESRTKNRHKAVVIGMFVAPEFAGRGVGRALLAALLESARTSDLELLVLTVTQGNLGAEKLYLSMGFTSFGIEPGAIKVENQRFNKNHMFFPLSTP